MSYLEKRKTNIRRVCTVSSKIPIYPIGFNIKFRSQIVDVNQFIE